MEKYSRGRCLLQDLLDARGMTQASYADKSGYSERMVSYFCTGERAMSPEALYTASKILRVNMNKLYTWIEN